MNIMGSLMSYIIGLGVTLFLWEDIVFGIGTVDCYNYLV